MTIFEMHQHFRVFAQQMGMQLVRAILPEEIDVYINSAIIDKVKEFVLSNVQTQFADKVSVQDNSISPINYIRTLYKIEQRSLNNNTINLPEAMYYTAFSVQYNGNDKTYGCRLIEPDKLENTLNDYCNGASYDCPICSIYNDGNNNVVRVYSGNKKADLILIKYISNPNKVDYNKSISCDLPEYTHNDIVQLACQKYFISVGSTTHNVNN